MHPFPAKLIGRVFPRRFRCYCIGAAKTGTTSIAAAFAARYSSRHEPEVRQTVRMVIDRLDGRIDDEDLRQMLLARDRRLRLELESSHPLAYLAAELAGTFRDARFIITMREPLSWLASRLNYHYTTDPSSWREYRRYFWELRHDGYSAAELALQRRGLFSLDTYLVQYADHYRRVLAAIPADRRIVIRTADIHAKIPALADIVGVRRTTLVGRHMNQSDYRESPLDDLDADFVRERIFHHCDELIAQFFPERMAFYAGRA